MDIEKMIEQFRTAADKWETGHQIILTGELRVQDALRAAATALSALQAENSRLRAELEYEREHANAYYEECGQWEAENEKLRAELEQVKAERDAAVSWAQKYTESIDMPCVACKHNTGDYVCTAICGNCGPMGAESCKWEFDFSGELKED